MLGWLQTDIAANAVRPDGRVLAEDDRSVQVHSCHGRRGRSTCCARCYSASWKTTTLEPRDIVVMCPDIETYAPLIVAGFGLGETAATAIPHTGCGSSWPTAH